MTPPYRQIRALHDAETITVYQAYPASIALPAIASQNLSASSSFRLTRMTWIKPSWCWMMYRSGYALKDANQAHILALRIKRTDFDNLLALSTTRVQWDPERDVTLAKLPWRSIQVGIGRDGVQDWVSSIVDIVDVTDRARTIKALLDEGRTEEAKGIVPLETEYMVGEDLRKALRMEDDGPSDDV